jgi:tRNA (guanine-N7-)-methyltransferase
VTEIASPTGGSRSSSYEGQADAAARRPTPVRGGVRDIPSYKVRRGRTGPTSREALGRLLPLYRYDEGEGFRPRVLEIGFGMGQATTEMAAADPARALLAVEVHPAGVAALLRRLDEAALTNVRVHEGDAVEVLRSLPEGSLDEVRLFFPDPWPKKRHVKRRFLRTAHADLVARSLCPGGFLHLATDWPAYAEHAREVLAGWELVPDRRGRPVTGYERRAQAAGRVAVDLVCRPPRAVRP